MASGNRIIAFYRGKQPDSRGRYLHEIQRWSPERLESVHDYIQWLFPLPEPSAFNPEAPLLDASAIAEFRTHPELRESLRDSWLAMLQFYGLEAAGDEVRPAPEFRTRAGNWLTPLNHNHLRITRILRSLRLLGLEAESQAFYRYLTELYRREPGAITNATFRFWTSAVHEPLPGPAARNSR